MALHRDNEGSEKADSGSNIDPVQQMTKELQNAYVKAGEEMGKQMAAAIVAIVSKIISGQGYPSIFSWHSKNIPEEIKTIIPSKILGEIEWVMIISNEVREIPLFQGEELWSAELASGHQLLALG